MICCVIETWRRITSRINERDVLFAALTLLMYEPPTTISSMLALSSRIPDTRHTGSGDLGDMASTTFRSLPAEVKDMIMQLALNDDYDIPLCSQPFKTDLIREARARFILALVFH